MATARHPAQGDIWWVNLDPTVGRETQKKRPCMVVSPDDMNRHLSTVVVAPITSTQREWPTRVPILLQRKRGSVALDQIRTIDTVRLARRITHIDPQPALAVLQAMFASA